MDVLSLVQLCKILFKVNYTGLQFVYRKVIKYHVPCSAPPVKVQMN